MRRRGQFRPRSPAVIAVSALAAAAVAALLATASPVAGGAAQTGPPQARAAASGISYTEAREILLRKVVKPKKLTAGDHLIAFRMKRPLKAREKVTVYRGRGGSFTAKGPTWFFWIDDDPKANFEHATRYVFIDARSGGVRVVKRQWWPLVNGRARWFAFGDYWNDKNWAYSTLKPLTAVAVTAGAPSPARTAASTSECAVIINGSGDEKAGFADNVEGMNGVIGTTFGYTTKKLTPPDNNKADFEKAVDDLVKDGCKDMLLYITSHGGKESVDMGTGSYTAADLKTLMDKYPTMEFKVVIQSCKSGSWIAPLGKTPKITITSTDSDKPSYSADPDTKDDPNPDDKGSEFTSGLIEDLKEIAGDQALLQKVQECVGNGRPLLVCKLEIAFVSALAKDEDAKAGNESPQKSP